MHRSVAIRSAMGTRRLALTLALLAGGIAPAWAQPGGSTAAPPGVRIITAEEIEQAGVSRLGDLFTLIDDWYAVSTEGFTWSASANGLASTREASWSLMIDGQPVDPGILDAQNINVLPISMPEVAYVEVVNTPALVSGLFAQAGVLHIHTRQPAPGPAFRGAFSAGNEIGDPGPYRYTSFASPNIDRIGPTFQAALSLGGGGWHARAHLKSDEHHATDEHIRARVGALYQGDKEPRLLLAAGGLDLAASGSLGRHTLFAGFSRLQDLLYFEPLGREGPTDHYFYHLGAGGDVRPGRHTGFRYRLSYTINDLDPRNNRGDLDFNWRQNAFRAHGEVRAGSRHVQGALGLSYDLIQGFTGLTLNDDRLIIPRAYGRVTFAGDPGWQPEVAAYFTRVEGEAGYGVLATLTVSPTPHQILTLTGSFTRQPYPERNRLWYWVAQGYDFFDRRGLDVRLPTRFTASRVYTADLIWRYQPSDGLGLTLSGAFRRFDDLTLAAYTFTYDPPTTAFNATTSVRGGVFGRVIKAGAELRLRLAPALEQRLYYAYVRYPTDDDAFFAAWRGQPWHRFSYTVRYVPLARLSLYGRLGYYSETVWPDYYAPGGASGGLYQAALPGVWLLDLSVRKRLWRDRLDLSLSLRNFLNEPYRTHPAGAVTSMVFRVRVRLYLHRHAIRAGNGT